MVAKRHAYWAPLAAVAVGNLLRRTDRLNAAEQAYRLAQTSQHPVILPLAGLNLGHLLRCQNRRRAALDAYTSVRASRHRRYAAAAATCASSLLDPGATDPGTPGADLPLDPVPVPVPPFTSGWSIAALATALLLTFLAGGLFWIKAYMFRQFADGLLACGRPPAWPMGSQRSAW